MLPWRTSDTWTLTGPATDAPREARSNASARAGRSSSRTRLARGSPSTSSGSCPRIRVRAPEADWMHPSGETSMVMAAEFWTSERSRASWSWTISYCRRWVRSRTVSRMAPSMSQVTGEPMSSSTASRWWCGAGSRWGAHALLLHAGQGEENHLHVVGMDEVEAVHPGGLDDGPAEGGLCGAVGPLEDAALVDDDDRVGELVEQTDQGGPWSTAGVAAWTVVQPERRHTTIIDTLGGGALVG